SNRQKCWSVMAGSNSYDHTDVDPESRLGNSCDPPGFRESCTARFRSHALPREPFMKTLHVNGYDMAYLDVGQPNGKPPLVCVHGSLNDFRIWGCVTGPLTKQHRLICVSLRHFFPEAWDGKANTYSIAQHVDDMIAFIEQLDMRPVDL